MIFTFYSFEKAYMKHKSALYSLYSNPFFTLPVHYSKSYTRGGPYTLNLLKQLTEVKCIICDVQKLLFPITARVGL